MTVDEVRAVLDTIIDPCSRAAGVPGGLVAMGLVRRLEVFDKEAGSTIRLTIGVTEPGCLMAAMFAAEARKRLEAMPGIRQVDVRLDTKFDWAPSDMSPAYRSRLEARRSRVREVLGHNACSNGGLAQADERDSRAEGVGGSA